MTPTEAVLTLLRTGGESNAATLAHELRRLVLMNASEWAGIPLLTEREVERLLSEVEGVHCIRDDDEWRWIPEPRNVSRQKTMF